MKFFNEIIDEVLTIGNEISDQQVDRMTKAIQGANHIFLAGAGRSGLMIRNRVQEAVAFLREKYANTRE
ncbi:MAG: hypothetical protein E7D77_05340 [Enterococcus faecalis]|nr:hypothetical protein [Enterococcus faecalis]